MKASDRGGERESIWTSTAETRQRPPLAGDATADVCVVGAGIAGLTTAYLLACEGRRVIVVDDGPIGGGQTCRTTAHLSCVIDDCFTSLIKLFGVKDARLIHESHARAIDRIESNVIAENIACDFERLDGFLLTGDGDAKDLDEELEAARECRCDEAVKLAQAPIGGGPCLRFPHQAQFHPLRYLEGLASAFERRGGIIHCGSHVESVKAMKGAVDIRVGGQRAISAAAAVVATNVPFNVHVAIHSKQAPYMTHVVACEVRKGSVEHALYWTMDDPDFYARVAPGSETDHLIVGGEDTKSGHPTDIGAAHRRIEEWTRERFPQAGAVSHRWSGQVMEPVDGPAFLGRSPGEQDVYVITGDSGMGMTHGTIGAMLITDLIAGRDNAWREI